MSSLRSMALSVAVAALAVGVLAGRVHSAFEPVRVRMVTTPRAAETPDMVLPLTLHERFREQPIAIIIEVQGATGPRDLTVDLDGRTLAEVRVPAGRRIGIDVSVASLPAPRHTLTIRGTRAGWSLAYLELSTAHRHYPFPVNLAITPTEAAAQLRLPPIALIPLFLGLVALGPRYDWRSRRWRLAHRLAAALVILLFGLLLAAPALSAYLVLLPMHLFLLGAGVLYAEPLSRAWRRGDVLEDVRARPVAPLPAWRETLLAGAALTLLLGLVLHAQVRDLSLLPDLGDPLFSIWRIAWVSHQIAADPWHLFDANIFYPARGTLTYSDSIILPSLMAMPLLRLGVHPLLVYNLLLLSAFVLSGLAMYVLARGLGFGPLGGWVSAVIFMLYPYRLDHYPHLELQMTQWMPLVLLGAHRLMTTGRWPWLALTVCAMAAQWYSSMYYAVFLSLYVAAFGATLGAAWRDWRRLALLAAAVLVGAGLAMPLARAYSASQAERGERPLDVISALSATPADYLQPTHRSAPYDGLNPVPPKPERALFPGVAPLVLGAAGAWPPWTPTRLAVLAGGLVAFDGSLGMNGVLYPRLYDWLSPFRSIRVPARFAILVGLTLALLSGWALQRWHARAGRGIPMPVVGVIATLLVVGDAWPDLRLVPAWRTPPPIYAALGPGSGAVLMEYPLNPEPHYFDENMPFLYFSAWHLTPTVNGYSGFQPESYGRLARAMAGFPRGETVAILQQTGVTHISVVCAIDGRPAGLGMVRPDQEKCAATVGLLDADPRMRKIVDATWEGAPALLYQIRPD